MDPISKNQARRKAIKNLRVEDQGEEEDEEEFLVIIHFAVLSEFSTKDSCI